ncbi:hypothetical protein ECANGB1_1202 [Enterospora canceri]|uniref:Mitochondrial import inner membrane translocase subunit TIM50 n=1 Tax=Enterospora canceri TaxID=1081671 RepID=A0A1Y1S6J5_9MICR|nr:hypothetical protein ECANGB1_1202 [Enterospora canceri]
MLLFVIIGIALAHLRRDEPRGNPLYFRNTVKKSISCTRCVPKICNLDTNNLDTIVLDLDHTLVHSVRHRDMMDACECPKVQNIQVTDTRIIFIRPMAVAFLKELRRLNLNIILFTLGSDEYVSQVLDSANIRDFFSRIYTRRQAFRFNTQYCIKCIKDCDILGDIGDYLIVDDNLAYFGNQNESVMKMKRFSMYNTEDCDLMAALAVINDIKSGKISKREGLRLFNGRN